MNQLLSCCEGFTLVALKDSAFLLNDDSNTLSVLKRGKKVSSESSKQKDDDGMDYQEMNDDNKQKSEEELNMVHAVAVVRDGQSVLYCAVARGDKSLYIYKLDASISHAPELFPMIVYNTPKRLSCMTFTSWPTEGNEMAIDITHMLLLVGDLAGDAHAYSLEIQHQRQRLLLGHTASMLTGLCICKNVLLTSDRDEKIRISSFPQTYVVEGFLLGHEAYITSIIPSPDGLVVSAGGDCTIRAWDVQTQSQIFEYLTEVEAKDDDTSDAKGVVPIDLSFSADGTLLSVIFDQSNRLDIYRLAGQPESGQRLELVQSTPCSSQPLGVRSTGADSFFVLQRQPPYLTCYQLKGGTLQESESKAAQALNSTATERQISMPEALLERDQYGQIKLEKLHETRGPSGEQPWNRVERVDIAKEANKRHKRRRREGAKK